MAQVQVIKIQKANQGNVFLINGVEVRLTFSASNVYVLEKLATEIEQCLESLDYQRYSKIFIENNRTKLLLDLSYSAFRQGFVETVHRVCDVLIQQGRLLILDNIAELLVGRTINREMKSREIYMLHDSIESYRLTLKARLEEAIRGQDKDYIWKVSNCFSDYEYCRLIMDNVNAELIEKYVFHCGEEYVMTYGFSWIGLYNYAIHGLPQVRFPGNTVDQYLRNRNVFKEVIAKLSQLQIKHDNEHFIDLRGDKWQVKYRAIEVVRTVTFDFSSVSGQFKSELKPYIKFCLEQEQPLIAQKRLMHILNGITQLIEHCDTTVDSFYNLNYFHASALVTHLQSVKKEDGKHRWALSTVRRIITELRLLLDWLLSRNPTRYGTNPFRKVTFNNTESFIVHTEYIPEAVVNALEERLSELPDHVQTVWKVMMSTGMRISEVLGLTKDCLVFDNEIGQMILRYTPFKVLDSREDKGLEQYHRVPIPSDIVDLLVKQIESTEGFRERTNANLVFFNETLHGIGPFPKLKISNQINGLIKKYNIVDESGNLFHFTHHQCRKTVIVKMLSEGASVEEVADFVAHQHTTTTQKYYGDIENRKIAEMDANYFDQIFTQYLEQNIPEDVRSAYSEEERLALLREIKLGARETPEGLGTCIKHVSFGPCMKKTCVGCAMHITGPQKLPKLYKLSNEQAELLDEMVQAYKNSNITNYTEFREYQYESHTLVKYQAEINAIEDFCMKRGIDIEQYREASR